MLLGIVSLRKILCKCWVVVSRWLCLLVSAKVCMRFVLVSNVIACVSLSKVMCWFWVGFSMWLCLLV